MGQKVHPTGIRLGISKPWVSTWYANTKDFSEQLFGDHKVRQYLTKELKSLLLCLKSLSSVQLNQSV